MSSRSLLPRLGFAWRLTDDGKTVVRGGYGVFFDSAEGREIDGAADVYPYVSRNNYIQSIGQPTPLRTSDSLFPSFEAQGLATPAANTFLAVSQSPEPRNPNMQQWSLGVQRELFANTTLEVNYIGTKGTNLLMRRNIAQALEYTPSSPTVAERKPYPNFIVYIDSEWGGRSRYDAFNTKLEHRGRGSLLTLAYTWAKSTDTKSAAAGIGATGYNGWQGFLNNHDPERDYGLSDFDVDHRLVGSFVYNIPVGSGERYAGDAKGVKNAIVGGWQVNGIYTWQRGFPITIQASTSAGSTMRWAPIVPISSAIRMSATGRSRSGSTRRRSRSRRRAASARRAGTFCAGRVSTTWTSRHSRTSSSGGAPGCSSVSSRSTRSTTRSSMAYRRI